MIYLAQRVSGGPIRIGTSGNLKQRLKSLGQSHRAKMRFLASGRGGRSEELFLHQAFAPLFLWGEWFEECHEIYDLADDVKADRLGWIPDFDALPRGWAKAKCMELFGSLDAAKVGLGYSPKTATSDVFGWRHDHMSLGVRLRFLTQFNDRSLPSYVMRLHGDAPKFLKSGLMRAKEARSARGVAA